MTKLRARKGVERQRRALPWEKVEKQYVFEGLEGRGTAMIAQI